MHCQAGRVYTYGFAHLRGKCCTACNATQQVLLVAQAQIVVLLKCMYRHLSCATSAAVLWRCRQ